MRSSSALMIALFGGRCPLSTLLTVAGRTGCDFEQEFVIVIAANPRLHCASATMGTGIFFPEVWDDPVHQE
jgi:hypothetical protein